MPGIATYSLLTVTVPASVRALVSLADVKLELNITSDTSQDAYLTRQISYTSTAIENYCNRLFCLQTVMEEFRPEHSLWRNYIPNREGPIQVTRFPLVYDPSNPVTVTTQTTKDNAVEPLVLGTDFEVNYDLGQVFRLNWNGNQRGWTAIKTVFGYSAGYKLPDDESDTPATPLPEDIQDAAVRMVKARWFARGRDPYVKSEQVQDVARFDYWMGPADAGNMTPDISDILDNYRIPTVA